MSSRDVHSNGMPIEPARNGNGTWKAIALVLLTALLTGAGTLVLNGRPTAALDTRVTAQDERIKAVDQRTAAIETWLTRVEDKLDRAIERTK